MEKVWPIIPKKHNDLTFIEYFLNRHCEGTFEKGSFSEESPKKPHGCQNYPKPPEKVFCYCTACFYNISS